MKSWRFQWLFIQVESSIHTQMLEFKTSRLYARSPNQQSAHQSTLIKEYKGTLSHCSCIVSVLCDLKHFSLQFSRFERNYTSALFSVTVRSIVQNFYLTLSEREQQRYTLLLAACIMLCCWYVMYATMNTDKASLDDKF